MHPVTITGTSSGMPRSHSIASTAGAIRPARARAATRRRGASPFGDCVLRRDSAATDGCSAAAPPSACMAIQPRSTMLPAE